MTAAKMVTEAETWREIARWIDAKPALGLHACVAELWCRGKPFAPAADGRLRAYDNPAWCYGPDDDYANMAAPDRVIAALWLALEAEDEANGGAA